MPSPRTRPDPSEEAAVRARALAVNLDHLVTARLQPDPQVFGHLRTLAWACASWCDQDRSEVGRA
jgi:hypothetical protein